MQTLHKFPKLNQQQHAEQFELKPNSNQTHQLTMPTTHTHRPPRMMESVLCRWDCNRISHKYWHMCGDQRGRRGSQTKPKAVAIRWFIGQFAPPPFPLLALFPAAHKTKAKSKTKSNSSCNCIDWQATGKRKAGEVTKGCRQYSPLLLYPALPFKAEFQFRALDFAIETNTL